MLGDLLKNAFGSNLNEGRKKLVLALQMACLKFDDLHEIVEPQTETVI